MIEPEFATRKAKMEPYWTPFLLKYCGFPSIYAACELLRKCTYIYVPT